MKLSSSIITVAGLSPCPHAPHSRTLVNGQIPYRFQCSAWTMANRQNIVFPFQWWTVSTRMSLSRYMCKSIFHKYGPREYWSQGILLEAISHVHWQRWHWSSNYQDLKDYCWCILLLIRVQDSHHRESTHSMTLYCTRLYCYCACNNIWEMRKISIVNWQVQYY